METTPGEKNQPTMDRQEFFRLVGTSIGTILLSQGRADCLAKAGYEAAPTQFEPVNFTLNLSDKANANLIGKGGYLLIDSVIVARTKAGDFIAVSAKCTHQGTRLVYKATENHFYCPLHLSRFDTSGKVLTGPAVQPLTRYIVESLSGSVLRVHG